MVLTIRRTACTAGSDNLMPSAIDSQSFVPGSRPTLDVVYKQEDESVAQCIHGFSVLSWALLSGDE